MSYVRVCDDLGGKPVEIPAEDDDTLPVETLRTQFPNAIGLKYLPDPNSDIFRAIRCCEGKLKPPKDGWDDVTFYCTYPPDPKRKADNGTGSKSDDQPASKRQRSSGSREVKCADLILLGLDWKTTEDTLKSYFEEKYGPILMALVKTDVYTQRSKGFGFIRFAKYEDQVKALSARNHEIDGRWVVLKPPFAKDGVESSLPSKIFLSRLQQNITNEDLSEYFSKYGEVADVFFPKVPFRGFAFLTFLQPESAEEAVLEQPHLIKGCSIAAEPANDQKKTSSGGGRGGFSGRGKFGRGRGTSRFSGGGGGSGRYRDYDDDYDSYGSGNERGGGDISKILAAALNDPKTISSLLSKIDRKPNDLPPRDYDRDYKSSSYDDYSYNESYNPYPKDKGGYGGSNKYNGRGSRY